MNVLFTTQVPLPFFNSVAEAFVLQHRYCILCRPQPPCQVRGVLIVICGVFIDRQAPGDYILQHQPAHGNRWTNTVLGQASLLRQLCTPPMQVVGGLGT